MKLQMYRWHDHPRAFLVQVLAMAAVVIVAVMASLTVVSPKVRVAAVTSSNDRATLLGEVRLEFNTPASREKFSPSISPAIDGQWRWEDPLLGSKLYRTAVFEPAVPYAPATDYQVSVSGIQSIAKLSAVTEHDFRFTTQPLPTVSSVVASE